MKNYLSFGGGVNSVAMMLLLLDEGIEFEAVNVWMPEMPETHEYILMLEEKGYPEIRIIMSSVKSVKGPLGPVPGIYSNLYDYCFDRHMVPSWSKRWCSIKFKKETLQNNQIGPAFVNIGYAYDERKRAVLASEKGFEHRYPLIEREVSRKKCVEIIKSHGLPVPIKSGCFFCPHQDHHSWKRLRRNHSDLFCRALQLEKRSLEVAKIKKGRPMYLSKYEIPLEKVVETSNSYLFADMAYPPCQCGL